MAWLVLQDGKAFAGEEFGFWPEQEGKVSGEVVFNTSMSGYQGIITDLANAGQLLAFTQPQIGNSGWCWAESEADKVLLKGIILRELAAGEGCPQADASLEDFCRRRKIPGLKNVDTRALARHIRKKGTRPGVFVRELATGRRFWQENTAEQISRPEHWVYRASTAEVYLIPGEGPVLAVLDLGVKRSVLRCLQKNGYCLYVFPARTTAAEIMEIKPQGLVVSNGPGDPAALPEVVAELAKVIGKVPILGIGLGQLLLALAVGGETSPLPFGHRGSNHPVVNLETGQVTITAQNHGYAVRADSLRGTGLQVWATSLFDGSVEGLRHEKHRILAVQYQPEGAPGPTGNAGVFSAFAAMLEGRSDHAQR